MPTISGSQRVGDGRKTVTSAGTAVQFDAQPCTRVRMQALPGNTDVVSVGVSTVSAQSGAERGNILYTGQYADFDITNMNLLYLDSAVDGEGVSFIYFI